MDNYYQLNKNGSNFKDYIEKLPNIASEGTLKIKPPLKSIKTKNFYDFRSYVDKPWIVERNVSST